MYVQKMTAAAKPSIGDKNKQDPPPRILQSLLEPILWLLNYIYNARVVVG
jgi:hypothetical protein